MFIGFPVIGAVVAIAANSSFANESDSSEVVNSSEVIKGRIWNYRILGTSYKQINDELESRKPNVEKIEEAAREIVMTGEGMTNWFPPGSEPLTSEPKNWVEKWFPWFARKPKPDGFAFVLEEKTYAKLKIWEHPDEFERLYSSFHEEARKMRTVAESGDVGAIKNQAQALGASCKSCHDVFREELD